MGEAPLASMTGTGAAALEHDLGRFEAEARSVNHRFLKTSVRTGGALPLLDGPVEAAVKTVATRGHVSVYVRYVPGAAGGVQIDEARFAAGALRLQELAERHGVRPPTLGDLLRLPGVVLEGPGPADPEALATLAGEAVRQALAAMLEARQREGALLGTELLRLLDAIEAGVDTIGTRARETPALLGERLRRRLAELLEGSGASVDPAWLAREVALLADKADVQEEIARLRAHLEHARGRIREGGAVGRALDFLVQEMHREVNTIGSKTQDLEIAHVVVQAKTDVERLREQVQNLE